MEFTIRFLPSLLSVRVPAGTSLLQAAREAGLPVASACSGRGSCARCGMRIVAGGDALPRASMAEQSTKQRNRIDPGLRLSCLVALDRDLTVTAPYW